MSGRPGGDIGRLWNLLEEGLWGALCSGLGWVVSCRCWQATTQPRQPRDAGEWQFQDGLAEACEARPSFTHRLEAPSASLHTVLGPSRKRFGPVSSSAPIPITSGAGGGGAIGGGSPSSPASSSIAANPAPSNASSARSSSRAATPGAGSAGKGEPAQIASK
eukprot:8923052-Pyramimonas_sp.AAC.1